MKSTKILALLLVVVMCFSVLASCNLFKPEDPGTGDGGNTPVKEDFTYYSWATSLGQNWNPHTWENNADNAILGYIETPLANMVPLDTEAGTYQWIFEAATDILDVTADHQDDLTKYGVVLPAGVSSAADVTDSYVYEIKLNPDMKWQNGDPINADTYIYSMQQLLDSKMRNYRANNYVSGTSALAGAYEYYNSEAPIYECAPWLVVDETGEWFTDESFLTEYHFDADGYAYVTIDGEEHALYISTTMANYCFGADWKTIHTDYGYGNAGYFYKPYEGETGEDVELPAYVVSKTKAVDADEDGNPDVDADGKPVTETVYYEDLYVKLSAKENPFGVFHATEADMADLEVVCANFAPFGAEWNIFTFGFTGYGDKFDWDGVGLYKVDDYTIRYVCKTAYEYNYFLTSCTSNWIVHKDTYESLKKEEGGVIVTTYGTSVDSTMSYGVYKLATFEDAKQVVFVQNENWYGWEKDEAGNLVSYTDFDVDGDVKQQYQTTKIVIDVLTQEAAYQAFLKGQLTDYAPTAQELLEYSTSDRLYKVDETYTMRFFFHTNLAKLQALDAGANNENSVVLNNYNFRKAMSLAIDRADFVTATEGWKPAYSLMNGLYHYDIYNDPTSSYRSSPEAMKAIVDLYGVEYGAGKVYATLEEAYKSITGYNLTVAKQLMKQAHDELVADGIYTSGEDITIQIAWSAGALTDADNAQLVKLNQYVNAALEGSGFGKITFTAAGNLKARYDDVIAGSYAIGWGAWGGAALYPFGMMQCYMDPDYTKVHESGCWSPKTEELTLSFTIDGEVVTDTLTWQVWSQSLEGTGKYAQCDNKVKLQILALLEQNYLEQYYCIPMAGTTVCTLLSYQVDEYTDNYNLMYGFGGLRLMKWNYSDAEWTKYVSSVGGTLNYK